MQYKQKTFGFQPSSLCDTLQTLITLYMQVQLQCHTGMPIGVKLLLFSLSNAMELKKQFLIVSQVTAPELSVGCIMMPTLYAKVCTIAIHLHIHVC